MGVKHSTKIPRRLDDRPCQRLGAFCDDELEWLESGIAMIAITTAAPASHHQVLLSIMGVLMTPGLCSGGAGAWESSLAAN
jgi:hypothetical protein